MSAEFDLFKAGWNWGFAGVTVDRMLQSWKATGPLSFGQVDLLQEGFALGLYDRKLYDMDKRTREEIELPF